jgi:RNA polymerase sigma factor (sigma-70 family)
MGSETPRDKLTRDDEQLLQGIRDGDSSAQRAFFDRYYVKLVTYARRHMGARLQQVEPPSDVAQSVMTSVLLGIPADEFDVGRDGTLWPLLVTIALNKIRNRRRKHAGPKRDQDRTVPFPGDLPADDREAESRAELDDLVNQLLHLFSGRRRQIVELILQDYKTGEIAQMVSVSERTVYDTRQRAMASLQELLSRGTAP